MFQRRLIQMGLRRQITLMFASLVLLFTLLIGVAVLALLLIRQASQQAVLVNGVESTLASNVALATLQCRRFEKDIMLNLNDPTALARYRENWNQAYFDLQQAVVQLDTTAITAEDYQQTALWQDLFTEYATAMNSMLTGIDTGQITTPQAANVALSPAKNTIRTLTESAILVSEQKAAVARASETTLGRIFTRAIWTMGLGSILMLGAFIFSVRYMRTLTSRLLTLYDRMKPFASEQTTYSKAVQQGDEIAGLSDGITAMFHELRTRATDLELQRHTAVTAQNYAEQIQSDLEGQLKIIAQQRDVIREMSIPILPIGAHVLMMPLVGALDSVRIQHVLESALEQLEQTRATHLIVDVTAVPVIDTQVGSGLLRLTKGAHMLGAQVVVVGIRPEVAQTLVQLGIQLNDILVYSSLRQSIASLLGGQIKTA